MSGQKTDIMDPEGGKGATKTFTFDHSYWSHSGFKARKDGYLEPANADYADQVSGFFLVGLLLEGVLLLQHMPCWGHSL